ncbi:putative ribonuclease H-like domain-containing protein [Tanacetum coccineum]|uniref:Ribonuclease H-like domain-containing protein n=1 Tax=Tanacetum coccineum TaxID=301880 RepID=A0ABQ5IH11_9ASTR
MQTEHTNSSNGINTVSTPVSTAGPSFDTGVPSTPVNTAGPSISTANESKEQLFERFSPFKNTFTLPPVPNISLMDNTGIFGNAYDDEDVEEEVDMNNAIGNKWVFRNKKDERVIVVKNKARLVAQGHTQEEGIDYDEVFAPIARIKAIRLFLSYASFKDFVVYQMDVNSAFLYGKIEEEVGQIDKTFFIKRHKDDIMLEQVYVDDIIFGSTKKQMSNEFETLMHDKFQMSSMGELSFFLGLRVKHKSDGIFISQDKYVAEILKKFDFASIKTASTPMETNKALVKDEEAKDVDVHLYRSMIGSLMYLKAFRPDIMFAVCACAWFQYPRDSPFYLEAFSDSDYAGASLDRKSTTGGFQFLGKRLILWQCKKQTIVANSTTEAECVAAANCCRQVGDEAVHKELGDRMERAATTASSLEAEQDSGSGPRCQDTILGDVDAQTRFETTSKQSNDPPLSKVNTFGSGEDSMQLMELMTHCTKLSALHQGEAPSTSPSRITSSLYLSSHHTPSSTPNTPPSFQTIHEAKETTTMPHGSPIPGVRSGKARRRARIVLSEDEDADEGTSWFQEDVETQEKNSVDIEVLLEKKTSNRAYVRDLGSGATHDVSTATAALVYIRRSASKAKDKGKAIMQELEPPKKLKKRVQVQISVDEELARETVQEERNQLKQWQARTKNDQILKQLWNYKAIGMKGNKKTLARKRAGEKKSEESSKRQKNEDAAADYEQEKAELRLWLKVAQDDEESVNPEILSTKYPIVDLEYQLLGQVGGKDLKVYKLTRADRSASYHGKYKTLRILIEKTMSTLYIFCLERFFKDHSLEGRDLLLWGDLRMIFDPDEKDDIWMNQLDWKLHANCGVHILFMDGTLMQINMLVEKKYPLP